VAHQHFSRKIKKTQARSPGAAVHAQAQAGTAARKVVVSGYSQYPLILYYFP
jgi:hypothetical protein